MNPSDDVSTQSLVSGKKILSILVVLIIVVSVFAVFFYNEAETLKQNPNILNERKIALLVKKVEKLIALPEGELPTVATVADTTALAKNPFFAKAKVGDQIIIYTTASKAYLYDPKADIIVEVASINIGKQ